MFVMIMASSIYRRLPHHAFPISQEKLQKLLPTHFRITRDSLSGIYLTIKSSAHKGMAGTIIIEDTSGFHRGENLFVATKSREILVLQYRDSDFKSLASLSV